MADTDYNPRKFVKDEYGNLIPVSKAKHILECFGKWSKRCSGCCCETQCKKESTNVNL